MFNNVITILKMFPLFVSQPLSPGRLLSCWLSSNVMALGQSSEPHRLFLGTQEVQRVVGSNERDTQRNTQVQRGFLWGKSTVSEFGLFLAAVSACMRVQTGVFVFVWRPERQSDDGVGGWRGGGMEPRCSRRRQYHLGSGWPRSPSAQNKAKKKKKPWLEGEERRGS